MMNIKQTFGCLRQFGPAYPGIFSIALFLLMSSALVFAQFPLLGDPDITLSGNDFVKISGY